MIQWRTLMQHANLRQLLLELRTSFELQAGAVGSPGCCFTGFTFLMTLAQLQNTLYFKTVQKSLFTGTSGHQCWCAPAPTP